MSPRLAVLLLAAGCTPRIEGAWTLVALEGNPPSVQTVYEGCDVTSEVRLRLDLEADGDGAALGDFLYSRSGTWDCGEGAAGESDTTLTGTIDADYEGEGDWELDVDLDEGGDFDLECDQDGDTMECEDEARREYTLERG